MSQSSSTHSPTLRPRVEILGRLTELARELAGAYRPATVIDRLAAAVTDMLTPDRLTILALDVDTNTLSVAFHRGGEPAHTDDPLLQLPLRLGPLAFPRHVAEQAARHDVVVTGDTPATWMGAPIIAAGRSIGVVALAADRPGDYGSAELELLNAIVAQAAIALENARLLELLSSGKRQWELSVDSISQAICILDGAGIVRRANRMFAELVRTPVTALAGRPYHSLLPATWVPTVTSVLAEPSPGPQDVRAGDRVYLVSSVRMAGAPEGGGAAVLLFDDLTEKRRLQEQLI